VDGGGADAASDAAATCGSGGGAVDIVARPTIDVVVHCADGRAIAHTKTAADGTATVDVVPGGMVTLLRKDGTYVGHRTFVGVQPGDHITDQEEPLSSSVATLMVTLPGAFAGASSYTASAGCAAATPITDPAGTVALDVSDVCAGSPATGAALALALDASGKPIAYAGASGISLAGGTAMVTLGAWQTDLVSLPLSVMNYSSTIGAGVDYGLFSGSTSFRLGAKQLVMAGGTTLPVLVPGSFGDAFYVKATTIVLAPASGDQGYDTLYRRYAPIPASVTMDFAADSPPRIHGIEVNAINVARPVVSWTIDGTPPATDEVAIFLGYANGDWSLEGPPAALTSPFRVPALPDDPYFAQFVPTDPPNERPPQIDVTEADPIPGYSGPLAPGIDGPEALTGFEIFKLSVGGTTH
jgi:hypothetical protein